MCPPYPTNVGASILHSPDLKALPLSSLPPSNPHPLPALGLARDTLLVLLESLGHEALQQGMADATL